MSRSIALLTLLSISTLASATAKGQSGSVTGRRSEATSGNRSRVDSVSVSGSQTIRLAGNDGGFSVGEIPAENLSQLLSGRFAGLQVISNGATGTGSRIRIRGQSSLLLSNDPLIVVDGVRLSPSLISTNTAIPSRVDDTNIEDIDTIEILGGPSATTLYGTGAANGVINITTRRGTAGRTRVRAYTENGVISDPHDYPDLWSLWGKRTATSASTLCTLSLVSAGTCAVDSLSHGNVLNIDSLTPIDIGYRSQYGVQVSGGVPRLQYFVAGEREDETGVYRMPAFEVQRLEAERGVSSLPGSQTRPSALARNSVRANVSFQPSSWMSLRLSSAYVGGDIRLVTNEEQPGLGYSATGGLWSLGGKNSAGVPLRGYAQNTAGDIMSQTNKQSFDHYLNSLSARISPAHWFEVRAQGAFDNVLQLDKSFAKRNEGPLSGIGRVGFVTQTRNALSEVTADVGATATFLPAGWLQTRTSLGWQRTRTRISQETAGASDLPVGATRVQDGAVSSGSTSEAESRVTGYYVEEVLSVHDKLFLTGAVRRDTPRLFGADLDAVYYPEVGISWLLFERDKSSKLNWLNALRLHTSYGRSGRIPSVTDNFGPLFPFLGNPGANTSEFRLKPENVAEFEGGVDITAFGNHSNVALTAYTSTTRDALISRDFRPSLGGAYTGFENGGRIQNDGVEVTIDQRLVNKRQFAVSFLLTGSANRNRLTKLPDGVPPIFSGNRSTEENRAGYPLFGLWSRTYTYADANHDGIITANELTVSDTAQFIASSFPTRAVSLSPTVEFLNHKLRFTGQIDSKWGFKKFNNTLRHQCGNVGSCRGLNDRTASLETQAAAVAVTQGTLGGMYEDGSFTRFREASVVYSLPTRWANALRASAWNVVLTGRNLGVSTNYTGADPESSVSTTDARQDEFFSTPPMRTYTLRFNFSF